MLDCSIIIPAYNAEKTINSCINCASNNQQKHFNYQIIVVNDGSTDNTLECLEKYRNNDNIVIVNKENGGASSARNEGLRIAQGEFIYFVDADDFFDINVLYEIILNMRNNNIDLVITDYYEQSKDGNKSLKSLDMPLNQVFQKQDVRDLIFYKLFSGNKIGLTNLWNKVFKKKIIDDNGIFFDERRTHGEDWLFCINYFERMQSFMHIDKTLYFYNIDGSQIWSKYSKTLGYCLVIGHEMSIEGIKKYQLFNEQEYILFTGQFLNAIMSFITIEGLEYIQIKKFLKNHLVKDVLRKVCKYNSQKLQIISCSRRDKLWIYLLRLGFYKKAIKILKNKR